MKLGFVECVGFYDVVFGLIAMFFAGMIFHKLGQSRGWFAKAPRREAK